MDCHHPLFIRKLNLDYLTIGIKTSSCVYNSTDKIPNNKPSLFIAANLYNNEPILNYWMTEVERLAQWADPSRVFISVYENGMKKGLSWSMMDDSLTHV